MCNCVYWLCTKYWPVEVSFTVSHLRYHVIFTVRVRAVGASLNSDTTPAPATRPRSVPPENLLRNQPPCCAPRTVDQPERPSTERADMGIAVVQRCVMRVAYARKSAEQPWSLRVSTAVHVPRGWSGWPEPSPTLLRILLWAEIKFHSYLSGIKLHSLADPWQRIHAPYLHSLL